MADIIVYLCPYDLNRPGGVQNQTLLLAKYFKKEGLDTYVIYPGVKMSIEDLNLISLTDSVNVRANGSVAPISFDIRSYFRLKKVFRDLSPDIIHVQEPLTPLLSLFTLIQKPAPILATFHRSGVDPLYKLEGKLFRRFVKNISKAVAVSEDARLCALQVTGVDSEVLFNAIDLSEFKDLALQREDCDYINILFFSRHEKRKGIELLLMAYVELGEVSKAKLRLKIIGNGPLTKELKSKYRFEKNICWQEVSGRKELIEEIAKSDIVVFPALFGESFGIALLEAMALKKPIIASDLGAFKRVGKDSLLYFRAGDIDDLKEKLTLLIADESLRKELQGRAFEVAKAYDILNLVEAYKYLYSSILS